MRSIIDQNSAFFIYPSCDPGTRSGPSISIHTMPEAYRTSPDSYLWRRRQLIETAHCGHWGISSRQSMPKSEGQKASDEERTGHEEYSKRKGQTLAQKETDNRGANEPSQATD